MHIDPEHLKLVYNKKKLCRTCGAGYGKQCVFSTGEKRYWAHAQRK